MSIFQRIEFSVRFIIANYRSKLIAFQCDYCGEMFYAPAEKYVETMMDNHLYWNHRKEWEEIHPEFAEG
jgi:hypothetical protein